tara:strand:- start:731 stop:1573 length:843 start_codon:yes stop_codon:yes gene_type:complete
MLGFALHRIFHDQGYAVTGALRSASAPQHTACSGLAYRFGLDVTDVSRVEALIDDIRPDVLINAVAVKRAPGEAGILGMFEVNAGFPRRLAHVTAGRGIQLVHFSTDAVFDGATGGYDESSLPSPHGAYALSKFLGEPNAPGTLTIRTSMIGRALGKGDGLVDWLLDQRGSTVAGHSAALFSGLPVDEIARFVMTNVVAAPDAPTGVYHLAADPIDKYTLLRLVLEAWEVDDIVLERDDRVRINRTLATRRAEELGNYHAPSWPVLIGNAHSFYSTHGLA